MNELHSKSIVWTQHEIWQLNNLLSYHYDNFCRQLKLYPKGKGNELGRYIALYLALANPTALPPGSKIYAESVLRIIDQKQSRHQFLKCKVSYTL